MEAIRIIREMRCATNGKYPELVLFENVFGLLSSGGHGRDYKTVLEAFTESKIPMPRSGRWANAGMVRGRGLNLAWVVKDASKHFRVPQRRRRLFLVCDFTGSGNRAAEILFITKSLSGYYAARESEREGVAAPAESGTGESGEGVTSVASPVSAFMAGQAKNARSIAYSESVSPTLKGSPSGLNQIPCICEPQIARTLTARGDSSPCVDRGQNVVAIHQNQHGEVRTADVAYTLNTNANATGRNAPLVAHPDARAAENSLTPWDKQQTRIHSPDGVSPTLAGADGGGGRNPTELVFMEILSADRHVVASIDCRNLNEREEVSGTLQSKSTGGHSLNYQNPVRTGYIVRRLTPTEAERLMSLPDGYTEYGHDGKMMSDSARYSALGNSIVVNVLAYIMQNIAEQMKNGEEDKADV